jgi:GTPase SAR1 family protein
MTMGSPRGESARALLQETRDLLAHDESAQARLTAAQERLDEPLRVAIAGKVKAGKSTLLNAFLGDRVAPTDTGECTRVVTWYRHGSVPTVTLVPWTGKPRPQPVRRVDGRLILTADGLAINQIERIEVGWPAPALKELTLVDTPGLASLSEELSLQSSTALTPEDSVSIVDAVVYLMRHLHATDANFLEAFRDQQAIPSLSAMTLAVLSRADEVGSGRIDALISAARVAQRYRTDPAVRALCLDVVPVAGLLAESGRTLRQVEFEALRDLAVLSREDRDSLLLSADRFVSTPLPDAPAATSEVRSALIQRFGVFGIRLATVLVRDGFLTGSALADELVRRSGLDEVTRILTTQFAARADALKSRSALLTVQRELRKHGDADRPEAGDLAERVEAALHARHDAEELSLITTLHTTPPVELPAERLAEAEAILGGSGTTPAARLRRGSSDERTALRGEAVTAIQDWRRLQSDPANGEGARNLCRVVIRSLEGVIAELDQEGQPAA